MITATSLMAQALGIELPQGEHRCFYCGMNCDERYTAKQCVSDTFNDWGYVAFVASEYVCAGCVEMLNEKREMPGREKPQKTRNYSWLITSDKATPLNKGQRVPMVDACLNPPNPPFVLCIATSGQRHLLFKSPVNLSRDTIAVQLEFERITFTPQQLRERISLVESLAKVLGKPALNEIAAGHAIMLDKAGVDLDLLSQWQRVRGEPLSRLALFLCPGKDALNDCDDSAAPEDA